MVFLNFCCGRNSAWKSRLNQNFVRILVEKVNGLPQSSPSMDGPKKQVNTQGQKVEKQEVINRINLAEKICHF